MHQFEQGVPADFVKPTQLPESPEQARQWQQANRSWWEANPMRYDWREGVAPAEFSRAFYEEIDQRFLKTSREFMPWKTVPFDPLIDFEALKQQDVLEIGCGNGSHAGLLAAHAKSYTGVDLTEYAVKSTTARMGHFGLSADIRRMDAENLEFPDGSFDFVWSWGVIHHSSNTRKILEGMRRVLRPGGKATVMVYNRSFFQYWVCGALLTGIVRGRLFKLGSLNQVIQSMTDGAMARYFKGGEWRKFASDFFHTDRVRYYGNKPEFWPIPGSKLKRGLVKITPNVVSRFFLNTMRQGSFLVAEMTRKD